MSYEPRLNVCAYCLGLTDSDMEGTYDGRLDIDVCDAPECLEMLKDRLPPSKFYREAVAEHAARGFLAPSPALAAVEAETREVQS